MNDISLVDGAAWYLVFLFSTTVHEASHAFTALKLGDDTAHRGGQVTLDPIPHIRREPFGMVLIPILSFLFGGWMIGWASAPYDPYWARRYPKRAALMALAGPVSNLLLMLGAAAAIQIGVRMGFFIPGDFSLSRLVESTNGMAYLATLVSVMFSLNMLLFLFNLLPVPPMDGSGVLALILPDSTVGKYNEMMATPVASIIGFVVAWKVFGLIYPFFAVLAIRNLLPGF
jgi:Zn-dependent protease